jgi:serine/threonine protein kinase
MRAMALYMHGVVSLFRRPEGCAVELKGLVLHQRYRIYEQAGTSGMATVCLASEIATSAVVTALILEPPITRDAGIVRRFLRSAEMGCRSGHPYVAPIEDYGEEQDICYMVTRFGQQGATLAELERKHGTLPMVQSAWICSCVASTLEGAVAYGGIPFHGALRPTSVIVTPSGDAQVTGFGTAPASGALDRVLGERAAAYAAPEQTEGRAVDVRTDLYTLGTMLYEMLTGRVPSTAEVRSFLSFEGSAHMEQFLRNIPKQLHPVLSGLLRWDPDERFTSPGDVIDALAKAGFPAPQRPLMEPTGPGGEYGPELDSETSPHPELLAVPIVGMDERYIQEKTGEHTSTDDVAPRAEVSATAGVPLPDEGFSWETAVPPSSEPVVSPAVPLSPQRRHGVVPIIAAVLVVAALAYVAIAKPFNKGSLPPGGTAVDLPTGQTVTTGSLSVTSTPPGASVILDGTDSKATTPTILKGVAAGGHTVLLRLSGYADGRQNVTVTPDTTSALQFALTKKLDAPKPPVEPGTPPVTPPAQVETTLRVTSTPSSAAIVLDGKETGELTPATIVVASGSHTILLKLAGYAVATRTVSVANGGQASLSIPLTKTSSPPLGSLRIASTPAGATVSVDGKAVTGKTPLTVDVALGHHTILVSLRGYETYARSGVEVTTGIQTAIAVQLVAIPVDLSYTNSAGGFGFKYPATWQIVQSQGSTEPLASAEARSPAGPFVRVEVASLKGSTVQAYLTGLRAELEKLPGLTISGTGTRTVGGIVYQHVVTLRAGSQTEYCLLQSGGNVCQLQCTAEVGLLNAAAPGFQTILGSFFAAP